MELVNHLQHIHWVELLEVVNKHVGAHNPLAIVFAPHSLAPTGVGKGEVQTVLVEVVPILCRDDMPQRIAEIVSHHFRLAAGAAGEVHERDVARLVHHLWAHEWRCALDAGVEVAPALWHFRTDGDIVFHRWAVGGCLLDMVEHHIVAHSHDGTDRSRLATIDDIFVSEQVGGRDSHCSEFMECGDGKPELVATLHYQHHHIATAYAQLLEICRGLVALALDVGKRELLNIASLVGPKQGFAVGLNARPFVHHIVGEIESR